MANMSRYMPIGNAPRGKRTDARGCAGTTAAIRLTGAGIVAAREGSETRPDVHCWCSAACSAVEVGSGGWNVDEPVETRQTSWTEGDPGWWIALQTTETGVGRVEALVAGVAT